MSEKNCTRTEGQGAKKQGCFTHTTLDFSFFSKQNNHGSKQCNLPCNCLDLNVKSLVYFKEYYEFPSIGVLDQDPLPFIKNASSLIFSNLKLKNELCMVNLFNS
jgi:hypothetical protein